MKRLNRLMQSMTTHTFLFIQGIICMVLMLVFGNAGYTGIAATFAITGMVLYLNAVKKQDTYEEIKKNINH